MATNIEAEASTLKRRARRRLIGAIALTLAAVIVLPMVFDAEKKPLDADISIQIPNQDAVVTRGPGAIITPAPVLPPQLDSKSDPAPKAEVKPDAKTETKTDAIAESKAQPKGEPKGMPVAASNGDAKRSVRDLAEEKRAAAILNAQADAAKTPTADTAVSSDGGFAVQVGAFAAEDKVKEARDRLGAAGIKTYTEKLDTKGGERTRVRARPFAGKDAADAARDKIRGLGFTSAVVVAR